MKRFSGFIRKFFLLPVLFYKKIISPALPSCCRYTPSCSNYFYEAVEKHGIIKGTILGFARIFRCNPRFKSSHDPVPEQFSFSLIKKQYKDFKL